MERILIPNYGALLVSLKIALNFPFPDCFPDFFPAFFPDFFPNFSPDFFPDIFLDFFVHMLQEVSLSSIMGMVYHRVTARYFRRIQQKR